MTQGIDLNEVFAEAFAEALAPLFDNIKALNRQVEDLQAQIDAYIDRDLDTFSRPPEPRECGVQPSQDDLVPGMEWTACDLPPEHEGPHNSGLAWRDE